MVQPYIIQPPTPVPALETHLPTLKPLAHVLLIHQPPQHVEVAVDLRAEIAKPWVVRPSESTIVEQRVQVEREPVVGGAGEVGEVAGWVEVLLLGLR